MGAPPPEGIAIRAGRLFDPNSGTNLPNQVIVIRGDRIAEVGPVAQVKIPAGARVIDVVRECAVNPFWRYSETRCSADLPS
jgi:imidazolonepropionase-like amidohydrolase